MRARMREHLQRRAQLLHDALSVRPDQEAAWQALQAALLPPEDARPPHPPGPPPGAAPLTTPERLDRMAERLARREVEFKRHADAIKQFYAVLSPAQQKTFDALIALHGGVGGDDKGMHGGMRHG
ncbi:MAG: Spy/CpxP family protein refolding chaperone [Caulobacteraceae bacterium]